MRNFLFAAIATVCMVSSVQAQNLTWSAGRLLERAISLDHEDTANETGRLTEDFDEANVQATSAKAAALARRQVLVLLLAAPGLTESEIEAATSKLNEGDTKITEGDQQIAYAESLQMTADYAYHLGYLQGDTGSWFQKSVWDLLPLVEDEINDQWGLWNTYKADFAPHYAYVWQVWEAKAASATFAKSRYETAKAKFDAGIAALQ